jgi:hypothetical protein
MIANLTTLAAVLHRGDIIGTVYAVTCKRVFNPGVWVQPNAGGENKPIFSDKSFFFSVMQLSPLDTKVFAGEYSTKFAMNIDFSVTLVYIYIV